MWVDTWVGGWVGGWQAYIYGCEGTQAVRWLLAQKGHGGVVV